METKSKYKRLQKTRKMLYKSNKKLMKARNERIWIENNPHIHILNYPFYKCSRSLKNMRKKLDMVWIKYPRN